MRLTLRTLLAYLDDTLGANEVKQIGQKVAESDTAQELIARIKNVTRRRRLTVPPDSGPSKLEAHTIAEYLDNNLSEDEVAEVEQICLGSDVHLAEVAACHQILTLVLGEPIVIPPSSYQRMYGLVKGREAIPFRRPPSEHEEEEALRQEKYETDETLRLGLPAFPQSNWKGRLVLILGALAACALLVLAISQALRPTGTGDDKIAKKGAANGEEGEKKVKSDDSKKEKEGPNGADKKGKEDSGAATKEQKAKKVEDGKNGKQDKKVAPPVKVAIKPPSTEVHEAGKYMLSDQQGLLLQYRPRTDTWDHLKNMDKVYTGSRLVSLPGFKSAVDTNSGVRLTLWGIQPEQVFYITPVQESMAELHHNEDVDVDLTLHRGRLYIGNNNKRKSHVLLRFDNPTNPQLAGVWDLTLEGKGAEVIVERWTILPPGEPFYSDKKHPDRKGPAAVVHLLVLNGAVQLRDRSVTTQLKQVPSDAAYVMWSSFQGTSKAVPVKVLPEWAAGEGKLPEDIKEETRKTVFARKNLMQRTAEKLASRLATSSVDAVLKDLLKSDDSAEQLVALRAYTALNGVPALIDAANNPDPKRGRTRQRALNELKRWITYDRDNDYALYGALIEHRFSSDEAEEFMQLMHGILDREAFKEQTYRALIRLLNADQIALRELAGWYLYFDLQRFFGETGIGLDIAYDPAAPREVRQQAEAAWLKLIKQKKIPPAGQ